MQLLEVAMVVIFTILFMRGIRNKLTKGIVNATLEGNLLYRDAASLLGVKVNTILKLAENLESS